uniref:Ionotropic receptor n=1 Tax=Anopheles gambiae TaxID=7165 RepID=A0A2Y9D2I5_ANOGA
MQLKCLHVGFIATLCTYISAGENSQQLVNFVAQIKTSHLNLCRDIALVLVEPLPIASKVIQMSITVVPVYIIHENWHHMVLQTLECGIVFTSLSTKLKQSQTIFSNKAKLVFIVDVHHQAADSFASAELFLTTQVTIPLLNSVLVLFNASAATGYFYDPIIKNVKQIVNSAQSIFPTVCDFNDLRRYELNFAFIPSESDRAVIETILSPLSIIRNGTLKTPFAMRSTSLLNLSAEYRWQFTLIPFGPLQYATCFIVPRAGLMPIWYIMVAPFDTSTWLCVLLTGVVIVVLLKRYGKTSLFRSAIMLLQSVFTSPNRIARTHFERRILTACMLGCVVLVSSYQSIIYSLISNPIFYPELDTEQLINSSCAVYMLSELEGIHSFQEMFIDESNFKIGKSCVCSSCRLNHLIQDEINEFPELRISRHRTHPFPMMIALLDRDYTPLTQLVHFYVSSFFEGGLTVKLLQDRDDIEKQFNSKLVQEYSILQLRISDLQIVWIVLQVGLALASLCFLGELFWRYSKRKKSLFKIRFKRFRTKIVLLKRNKHK